MEKYYGLDVNELYGVKDALTCWILYQTSEEQGKKVRLWSNKGPLFSILNVLPGSLKYIVYESGEKYLFEDYKLMNFLANQNQTESILPFRYIL